MKRNPVLKAFAMTALALSLFASCSKKDGVVPPKPPEPPTDGYKLQNVTRIDFTMPNSNGKPTRVALKDRTTSLGVFSTNSSGEYRFEFHGKNGRDMLQGDPRNPNITTTAVWSMNAGDTVKQFKNGVLYRDFVTQPEDNVNDGIAVDFISGTPVSTVKTNTNTFVTANGDQDLPKLKLKAGI